MFAGIDAGASDGGESTTHGAGIENVELGSARDSEGGANCAAGRGQSPIHEGGSGRLRVFHGNAGIPAIADSERAAGRDGQATRIGETAPGGGEALISGESKTARRGI